MDVETSVLSSYLFTFLQVGKSEALDTRVPCTASGNNTVGCTPETCALMFRQCNSSL